MPAAAPLPTLIAHRGNAAEFPENTLPALHSALELGVNHVEFDVHLTADHMPVVLHDSNLKRTAGVDRNALEMTWDELSHVAVNESERLQNRYTDVGVPSLTQVVELLTSFPEATAFVELKRASLRAFSQEMMVRRVCDVLRPVAGRAVIISFDLPAVDLARRSSSHRIGWVLSEYTTLSAIKAEAITPDFLFCDHQMLPTGTARLWRGPWQWAIYEVVSRQQALDLSARGAGFIETMEVRRMLRELRQPLPAAHESP